MIAPAPPPEHDVFISYSSVDNELAQRLAEHLEDIDGIRPFVDRWHLVPGETAQERLEEVLASVPAVAVLVGDEGLGPWQDEEVRAAIKRRAEKRDVRVIPVLLPGVSNKSVELPAFLDRYLHVDFADSIEDEDALKRLVAGIRGRPPGRRVSQEVPPKSLFATSSTNELMTTALRGLAEPSQLDPRLTLRTLARLLVQHRPEVTTSDLLDRLERARSEVYDIKYAPRDRSHDERYLDFDGWQRELQSLLFELGVVHLGQTRALNVGIGNGNECPNLYSHFESIVGVDISSRSLELAKERMPFLQIEVAGAERLSGIPTNKFDLYLSLRTFQSSFFDIEAACLEVGRVLRTTAVALISVPWVYVDHGQIARGLQHSDTQTLDPHLPWEIADRVRRGLHLAGFEASIRAGLFEIYVTGRR